MSMLLGEAKIVNKRFLCKQKCFSFKLGLLSIQRTDCGVGGWMELWMGQPRRASVFSRVRDFKRGKPLVIYFTEDGSS